jgi:type I restriction enzyme S subunit
MSTATLQIEKKIHLVPQLRFIGYDGEWKQMKLGQVCNKIQDGNYGGEYPKADEFVEIGIPFLTSKALGGDGFLKEDKIDFIPIEKHIKLKKAQLKLNDVLFTNRGSNVGSIGFTDIRIAHGNIGPQLTLLRSELKIITPYFLYQIMKSETTVKQIRSQDSGSAMNFFGINTTSKFKLSIPSLPEQQKIVSFLSAVDEKIQQLSRKKELLCQYKKGVMQQLFSGKLRFKDENGEDYADWEEKKLGDFCTFFSGGTPTSTNQKFYSGTIPFIGSGNIYDSEVFSFISEEALNSSSAKIVEKGDLLYALYGANSGELAISKMNGAINQAILCIRNQESIEYLYYVLLLNKDNIVAKFLQGGQGNLSAQIIKRLKYKFPSIDEQQKIANFLSSIDAKIESTNQQITQTHSFKKGLLQRMFV